MDFPIGLSLNDKFKTLFTIRRESLVHWTYGYKVAVLILLEKEPLLREARLNLKEMEFLARKEKARPLWFKQLRSFFYQKPIPIVENLESAIDLIKMQIRDIETEIEIARSEITQFDLAHDVSSLTYDQVQSLSGEAFASKIAENAAISTWACEHRLPEDVARAVFDAQALPPLEQDRFFNLLTNKVVEVEKTALKFFSQQPEVSDFLVDQVNKLASAGGKK